MIVLLFIARIQVLQTIFLVIVMFNNYFLGNYWGKEDRETPSVIHSTNNIDNNIVSEVSKEEMEEKASKFENATEEENNEDMKEEENKEREEEEEEEDSKEDEEDEDESRSDTPTAHNALQKKPRATFRRNHGKEKPK